jgi:hypothetical protein
MMVIMTPLRRFALVLSSWLVFSMAGAVPSAGQSAAPPDVREAKPERPTVATHAYAVASGIVELEAGVQRQRPAPGSSLFTVPVLFKIGLGHGVQLDLAPGWVRQGEDGLAESGVSDLVVGLKWTVATGVPLLEDVAIQPTLKLPTGSLARGTGTGTTDVTITAISSRSLGPVSLDVNAAWTRRSGDGTAAPVTATMWTCSTGVPVRGPLGWTAEVFGYPGTSGPAGSPATVSLLTGPTWKAGRTLVFDAGAIFTLSGPGTTAVYAGLTWNMGRLPFGGDAARTLADR